MPVLRLNEWVSSQFSDDLVRGIILVFLPQRHKANSLSAGVKYTVMDFAIAVDLGNGTRQAHKSLILIGSHR